MREQQDVSAAEVVQPQDLLRDRWRNSLALARFPDLGPNRVAPESIAGEWLGDGLGAVGAYGEQIVAWLLTGRCTRSRPERHQSECLFRECMARSAVRAVR